MSTTPAVFPLPGLSQCFDDDRAWSLTFLFGAARSGTTWLAKLLDSSPEVLYLHEPLTKGRPTMDYHAVARSVDKSNHDRPVDRGRVLRQLVGLRDQFSRPPFFAKHFDTTPPFVQAAAWYLRRALRWRSSVRPLPNYPLHLLIKDGLGRLSLPLAARLSAKSVVLLRHPCAVVSSWLRGQECNAMNLVDRQSLFADHRELCESLGLSLHKVEQMQEDEAVALDWLVSYLPLVESPLHPDSGIRWITYEQLVEKPDASLGELFSWLGLEFTPQSQAYLRSSSEPSATEMWRLLGPQFRYYSVTRRDADPAGAWRKELPGDSIERVMQIVRRFPLSRFWDS